MSLTTHWPHKGSTLATMRKGVFRTARENMDAVDRGEAAFWNSLRYPVHKDRLGAIFHRGRPRNDRPHMD